MNREQLVSQINAKVRTAYKELFTVFYGPLAYYCLTYIRRRDVAEDIVQDAFGRLWETAANFHNWDALTTYLYTTVRNASLDHIKHLKVEQRYGDSRQERQSADMEYEILREETYRLLFRAVDELPPRSREVFRLYLQGYDGPRIAQELGMAVDTVRTHRKHALRILREKLGHLFVLVQIFGLI